MGLKHSIEKFVTDKKKSITGKGPRNLHVDMDGNNVQITVLGILTRFEAESLKDDPEFEEMFIRLRSFTFRRFMTIHRSKAAEAIGREILEWDIAYNVGEDKAVISLEIGDAQ